MWFIETPVFTKIIENLLSDDEYRRVQQVLACNPEAGRIIGGGGGLRKFRWSSSNRQKGKRGGVRLIYYVHRIEQIYMIYAYDKDQMDNLTNSQLKVLKNYVKRGVL